MTVFDTNVLLYAADQREPRKRRIALELLAQTNDAILLWQVACEFVAASRKLAPHGFSTAEAWDQLDHYVRAFPLVLPSRATLLQARALHEQQWAFWDAMLVAACLEAGADRLYTEDLPGQEAAPSIKIINPFTRA